MYVPIDLYNKLGISIAYSPIVLVLQINEVVISSPSLWKLNLIIKSQRYCTNNNKINKNDKNRYFLRNLNVFFEIHVS